MNIIGGINLKESKFEEKVKIIYLKNAVDKATRLIHFGIKELEGINFINSDNYDLIFLFFSRGFELLMKSMVCFKSYEDDKSFPTEKEMKEKELGSGFTTSHFLILFSFYIL